MVLPTTLKNKRQKKKHATSAWVHQFMFSSPSSPICSATQTLCPNWVLRFASPSHTHLWFSLCLLLFSTRSGLLQLLRTALSWNSCFWSGDSTACLLTIPWRLLCPDSPWAELTYGSASKGNNLSLSSMDLFLSPAFLTPLLSRDPFLFQGGLKLREKVWFAQGHTASHRLSSTTYCIGKFIRTIRNLFYWAPAKY